MWSRIKSEGQLQGEKKGTRYKERDAKRNDALRVRWFVDVFIQAVRAGGRCLQREYVLVFVNSVAWKTITAVPRVL